MGLEDQKEITHRPLWLYILVVLVVFISLAAFGVALYFGVGNFVDELQEAQIETKNASDYHVLVLGAGISGLTAARTLAELGSQVTLLEGADRICGRIKEDVIAGINVEIGTTQYRLGNPYNPITKLAQEAGVETSMINYGDFVFLDGNGQDVTEAAKELMADLDGIMGKMGELRESLKEAHDDMSIQKALRMYGWKNPTPLAWAVEYFYFDSSSGITPDFMSVVVYMADVNEKAMGDTARFVYDSPVPLSAVCTKIHEQFSSHPNTVTHMNEVITEIHYNSSGVTVLTSSGKSMRADFAITTFSIGVLQSGDITFVPELPAWKMRSIHNHFMGHDAFIYLKFNETFWNDNQVIIHADTNNRGHFPFFANLNSLKPEKENILTAITTKAEFIGKLTDEQLINEIMMVLKGMYGQNISDPIEMVTHRWSSDPLFYGAYTNRPPGYTDEDVEDLAAPLHQLYFSGDATSKDMEGWTNGAYFAGKDTADDVYACMLGACETRE